MTETNLTGTTPDINVQNIEALKSLFPEVCTDGKMDFEKLQQLLGKEVDTSPERYNFTWNGKSQALHLSQSPSTGTLMPCKEESRNFDSTQNLYIEGDNLEVLKLLQKPYHKAVKMIYIDPPYNTGSDFVYPDDYKDSLENYLELTGQVDSDGRKIGTNAESNGRYHTDWLNMMYPRLRLARNLLRDDGVIFISIDDHEQANLKKICDEIFGEDNFIADFPRVTKKGGKSSDVTAKNHDYILMYGKSIIESDLSGISHDDSGYNNKDEYFEERGYYKINQTLDYDSLGYVKSLDYPIIIDAEKFYAGGDKDLYEQRQAGEHGRADWTWRWSKDLFQFGLDNGFIEIRRGGARPRIYTKTYQRVKIENIDGRYKILNFDRTKPLSTLEFTDNKYSNDNAKKVIDDILKNSVFEYTKPPELIKKLTELVNDNDFIVLDFFSGSATTAHAVMQLNAEDIASGKQGNRKFIMVQLPEPCKEDREAFKAGYKNICEIGKERIRRAGDKIQKELEEKQKNASPDLFNQTTQAEPVLDIGFKVFKLSSSNIKKWNPDYEHLDESLWQNVNSFTDGRTELDVVYEIMLKLGLKLTDPVEEKELAGKKVYSIARGILIICLNKDITTDLAHAIVGLQKTTGVEEMRVVFNDAGFKDDVAKTNCKEILKQGGIQEFVTI
ncbi:MAG TPA: site-specific DNA-methyltransferase [Treponema sp.]|nr:site-specific DNA-methyltransferase [Treponema sp.]